ncbi:MAG: helix-turn-helix transcriptional regulator [Clostridiaceae bacterium]|nr:helix-turn-helix transcriptional regulator [Clostridiaceae bacterium]
MDFAAALKNLMDENGVTNYRLSKDIGCSPTSVANWLAGKEIKKEYICKIADYFSVSLNYLLGDAEGQKNPNEDSFHTVSDNDIKFALFGGEDEISDEMYDEVKRFAKYVKQRWEHEKGNKE